MAMRQNGKVYIRSRKEISSKNPANTFLVLYAVNPTEKTLMFSHKDKLRSLGFKYFPPTGTYSLPSARLTPGKKAEMARIGVDLTGYDSILDPADPQPVAIVTDTVSVDPALEKIHLALAADITHSTHASAPIESIERLIEELARGTDKAAAQAFIKDFLEFSARFYTYSVYNQMLIWIQTKGNARFVAGAKKWEQDFGRRVSNWKHAIVILAPVTSAEEVEDSATGKVEVKETIRFKRLKVFDVSATVALPDCKKTFEPMSRKIWSKDSNEDSKHCEAIIIALKDYAARQGVVVAIEDMDAEKGGYSAGGRIVINRALKGINLLSTLVHELAHELLHWKTKTSKRIGQKEKEIDAESTAYIVLKHFGVETKDATNYLALWRANGEDVRARRRSIQKAAMKIIDGIKSCSSRVPTPERARGEKKRRRSTLVAG